MARFLKYEVPTPEWEQLKELIEGTKCSMVELGERIPGLIASDILWEDEPLPVMEQYEVYPDGCGVHTFLGMEWLYELEYRRKMGD